MMVDIVLDGLHKWHALVYCSISRPLSNASTHWEHALSTCH